MAESVDLASDPEVDALFDLPADAFVAARDGLARTRRAAGEREVANAIKQLRRPTLSAWALNQLARRHADDVRTLVEQGAALAAAQEQTLAGGAADLREAGRARTETLRRLTRAAEAELAGKGGGAHRDEVVATLTAASLDPAAGDVLLAGRLSEPLDEPSGFGGPFSFAPAPAAPAARPATRREGASGADGKVARRRIGPSPEDSEAAQEAREREAARLEWEAVAASARADATTTAEEAIEAQEASTSAAAAADEAAQQVAALEEALAEARGALASAEQEAGRRRQDVAAAREAAEAAEAAAGAVEAAPPGGGG